MNFASDNWAGACPAVQDALGRLGSDIEPAYGGDSLTQAMQAKLQEVFETDLICIPMATGSAANALAMGAMAKPAGLLITQRNAHLNTDEYNGPERVNPGQKIVPLPGHGSKLQLGEVSDLMAEFAGGGSRRGQLSGISLTQATELGQVYSCEEISALSVATAQHGLHLHMDGARFANALVHLGVTPAEMTWREGVDSLSLGFTKNGAWCADLLILFVKDTQGADYLAKQMGHGWSKPRFIAAQVLAMLEDDLWLKNAAHANAMTTRLADALIASNRVDVPLPPQANEVFAYFANEDIARLHEAGAKFYPWPDEDVPEELQVRDKTLMRLVTSFATDATEVERFVEVLGQD